MSLDQSDLAFLATVPLFEGFATDDLRRIGAYLDRRRFSGGQVVIWEEKPNRSLYIIRSGSAVVTKTIRGEVESVLAHLGPRAHFGELTLIDGQAASGNVTAEETTEVYEISADSYQRLITEDSHVFSLLSRAMLRALASRLRATNARVREAVLWGLDAAAVERVD